MDLTNNDKTQVAPQPNARVNQTTLAPTAIHSNHVQTIIIRDDNNIPIILIGFQRQGF